MKQTDWRYMGKIVLFGAAKTVGLLIVFCLLIGFMISQEWIPTDVGRGMAVFAANGALFLSCYLSAKKGSQNRLPICLAVAAVFWTVCMLAKTLVFSEYEISIDWKMCLPVAAAVIAGVLASRKKSHRR